MITLNKIVFDILEILYGGNISDDARITERQIAFWVNEYREILVHNEITTKNQIEDLFIQKICVDFELVNDSDCCTGTDCKILRSTKKIPMTISRGGIDTIISVASLTGNTTYPRTQFFRKRTAFSGKYSNKKIKWFLKDGYMYLLDPKQENGIEQLVVFGVFVDPEEAAKFKHCDGEVCFTWDSPYPVNGRMAKTITDLVVKERGAIMRQMPGDTTNDNNDNTLIKGKQNG